uniref:Uncharacterized protein n=1 Tax=Heterorhabditis bacteriophora TaxID=37862 RepID=A0A1I7X8R1_HETBA
MPKIPTVSSVRTSKIPKWTSKEYDTRNSGRPSTLNDREKEKFCGQRRVARSASLKSVGLVALMLQNLRCGEFWTSVPILSDHG